MRRDRVGAPKDWSARILGDPSSGYERFNSLFGMFTMVVTLPLLSLLRDSPEFFVVRGAPGVDIWLVAVLVCLVIPGAIGAIALLMWPVGLIWQQLVFLSIASMGATKVLEQVGMDLAALVMFPSVAGGVLLLFGWNRCGFVRQLFKVLSYTPPVLLLLFMLTDPLASVWKAPNPGEARVGGIGDPAPVVLIIFDELPVISLMDGTGDINAARFPNFKRLSEESTWYRNATTVADSTIAAVPAILTGKYPDPESGQLPTLTDHPNNLFTLLEGRYRVNGVEPITQLCPEELCGTTQASLVPRLSSLFDDLSLVTLHSVLPESLTGALPPIDQEWGYFAEASSDGEPTGDVSEADFREDIRQRLQADRNTATNDFLSTLDARTGSVLYFHHSLVPHRPWEYLPSGQRYPQNPRVPGVHRGAWDDRTWLVDQGLQRHLLQVGAADRWLGEILQSMEEEGLLERSVLVVTSDHGVSFRENTPLRAVEERTLGSIAPVPLFISFPGQTEGSVVDTPVETVDVLPTVVDALDIDLTGWEFDGVSLLDPPASRVRRLYSREGFSVLGDVVDRRIEAQSDVDRRITLRGGWEAVYGLGLSDERWAKGVIESATVTRTEWKATIDDLNGFRSVESSGGVIPSLITGAITEPTPQDGPVDLAVTMNGELAGATRTFDQVRSGMFSFVVDPGLMLDGENSIELFAIEETDGSLHLQRIDIEEETAQTTPEHGDV